MGLKDDPMRLIRDLYPMRFITRILYSDMDAFAISTTVPPAAIWRRGALSST